MTVDVLQTLTEDEQENWLRIVGVARDIMRERGLPLPESVPEEYIREAVIATRSGRRPE